jgi:hypothetical protein
MDHYAAKDDQKFDDLLQFYAKAMELEYNFFSAHETPNWTGISPSFLGIDFDDTISVGDTISQLCKAGLKAQGKLDDSEYQELLVKYLAEYEAFMLSNLPQNSIPQATYRGDELGQFMESYSRFEDSMLSPVENAKILKGISPPALITLAQGIAMKEDAVETIKYALHNNPSMEPHIVSVNWSKRFLQSMVNFNMPEARIAIHANELQGFEDDSAEAVSTGLIDRRLTGPEQKGELLRSLIAARGSGTGVPSVYIGDSLGDLSALLVADIGVVVGTSSSLRKVCSTYGVKLKTLDSLILRVEEEKGAEPTLYVAESWAHIGFCMFGKGYVSSWLSGWVRGVQEEKKGTHSGIAPGWGTGTAKGKMSTVLTVAGSDSGVSQTQYLLYLPLFDDRCTT